MYRIKHKIKISLIVLTMALCTACGQATDKETNEADGSSPAMEGSIEVVENLPDRDIKVPDYLKGEDDSIIEKEADGEESDLEEEEEPVYHLSGEEQTEKASQIAVQIEDSINQVLTDKEFYPNVTGISVNPECTEFNVTFSSRNISLYENVLHMSLCIVGDRFQLYQGKQEEELETIVNYIDGSSGEIFSTISSKEIE